MQNRDIRTLGYVMKRTNYGEFDRILNLLTPEGKISVIAKGVRKEKSKLAGGIEMFTLTDFNIHFGRSEFGVATGAKMLKHYDKIVKDLNKMEVAAMIFKKISRAAEGSDSPDFFKIVDQSLVGLNMEERLDVIEAWSLINLKKVIGEEINLYRDVDGKKLEEKKRYSWNSAERAFSEDLNGEYGANEIKMLRLMASNDLSVISRVKVVDDIMVPILRLVREVV